MHTTGPPINDQRPMWQYALFLSTALFLFNSLQTVGLS